MLMESMESMELVEPIFQVSEALRIIEDVFKASNKFLMNKHQCKSLTNCLLAIGEKLRELPKEVFGNKCSDSGNTMIYPAFNVLLTVLRKTQVLLSKYTELRAINCSVLIQTKDQEVFKEIHAELDMLNLLFHFEDFEYTSKSDKSAMLIRDADEDLKDMSERLNGLAHADESGQAVEVALLPTNVERVKMVVLEKSEGISTSYDDLPSFLKIDPANVEIKDPICIPKRLNN